MRIILENILVWHRGIKKNILQLMVFRQHKEAAAAFWANRCSTDWDTGQRFRGPGSRR